MEASLRALEELSAGNVARRAALSSKLEQLEYEAKKAFEQYDAVDAGIGLQPASWNGGGTKSWRRSRPSNNDFPVWMESDIRYPPKRKSESVQMGDHFAEVWQSDHCPPTLKKMIFRTAIEEITVRNAPDKRTLELIIHWKGGAHTQLAMERPHSATETTTPLEALEIIRRMAVRHGDDQIASVLNRPGYSTGKVDGASCFTLTAGWAPNR